MLEFVGQMPVRHRLSARDQQAVADYVIELERRG